MKKLFAVLFCALVMSAPSFAQELSYEIDPVATTNAPWKVGEKIIAIEDCELDSKSKCYREFLGMTKSGQFLLQEFYLSGEKFTNPLIVNSLNAVKNDFTSNSFGRQVNGSYISWFKNGQRQSEANLVNGRPVGLVTMWYENGQKSFEGSFKNGAPEGVAIRWYKNGQKLDESFYIDGGANGFMTSWHENGQKEFECNLKEGSPVGVCRVWDEQGNLIKEEDFGAPKN